MLSQIDTKDILFICGGAFVDLEKTISERSAGLTIVVVVYSTEIALRHLVSINYLSFPCGVRTLTLTSCTSRRQDSSIGFGAPIRTNMRSSEVTDPMVTSSLLESVSILEPLANWTPYGLLGTTNTMELRFILKKLSHGHEYETTCSFGRLRVAILQDMVWYQSLLDACPS